MNSKLRKPTYVIPKPSERASRPVHPVQVFFKLFVQDLVDCGGDIGVINVMVGGDQYEASIRSDLRCCKHDSCRLEPGCCPECVRISWAAEHGARLGRQSAVVAGCTGKFRSRLRRSSGTTGREFRCTKRARSYCRGRSADIPQQYKGCVLRAQ